MIFVVDDHADTCQLIARLLAKAGYASRCYTSGTEALGVMPQQEVSLLILDLLMPGMSGLEILRQVRADDRLSRLPVVMLSGVPGVHDLAEAKRLGIRQFISKSRLDWMALADTVREILPRRGEIRGDAAAR